MDSFDLVRIRDIWKRLFDMDVEKKRRASSFPVGVPVGIGQHVRQLEMRYPEMPLADRLLAEIEEAGKTVKTKPQKRLRLPPQPESRGPGVNPGDVFRIFGSGARIILMEADWVEIPEADRQAIAEEAARWAYEDGVFKDDGQWHRANMVVRSMVSKPVLKKKPIKRKRKLSEATRIRLGGEF
jgi:hypothetical protein